ncbi:hypothetical protein JRO89_XS13G0002600 [Xanthoceras sorbifolium]|uniref:Peptidase S54 rhomboid domain-containing protein n=1 Tax=Xanthoceras sorbifolium TaxID=99658 RepID=A0ABQ8H5N4_9ROSI|nr:hypothetical protein JRO89_XS13G0002600 [Xanthoceras sorbifolium]
MQRLLSLKQFASNFPKNTTNIIFSKSEISHTNQTIQNQLFSSFSRHPFYRTLPWRSQHSRPLKTHASLPKPLFVKRHLCCLSNTQLRKTFVDCGILFSTRAQFLKRSFQSLPNFASHRRSWRSWFQRLSADEFVLGLIIANAAVFILWRIADQKFMMNNFTISLDNFVHGRLHTLITSAFSHVDIEHILSNMIGLYFFGMNIGRSFGPEYLLKLYLAGAIGGSVFYLVHHAFLALSSKNQGMRMMDPSKIPALGASGAVNAIMLLNILLNPKATLYIDFIIPVPAALLGIFLIGKDTLRIIEGNSNISGSCHLGGAAVAAIAWARLRRGRF